GQKQPCLGRIDLLVQRNAYGRQIASFSTELNLGEQAPENPQFANFLANESTLSLTFIRAPQAVSWGTEVQVLLRENGKAVCLQQNNVLVSSFHPELSESTLLHQYFLSL
ncbi:MAG: pyridoxal 5'-phosphate synthase glutaminase subunit PdxT, partial [Spirochaetota bacterium]